MVPCMGCESLGQKGEYHGEASKKCVYKRKGTPERISE